MYITKAEARTLLRDVFKPELNRIVCALEDVEAAILAPLISETQVQEAGTKTTFSHVLKGSSITVDLVDDLDAVGGIHTITIKVNSDEELSVEIHKKFTNLKQVLQGECTYTHNSVEDMYDITLVEENDKEVSFEIEY